MGGLETSFWMKSFKPIFLSLIKAEMKKEKEKTFSLRQKEIHS